VIDLVEVRAIDSAHLGQCADFGPFRRCDDRRDGAVAQLVGAHGWGRGKSQVRNILSPIETGRRPAWGALFLLVGCPRRALAEVEARGRRRPQRSTVTSVFSSPPMRCRRGLLACRTQVLFQRSFLVIVEADGRRYSDPATADRGGPSSARRLYRRELPISCTGSVATSARPPRHARFVAELSSGTNDRAARPG